MSAQLTGLLVEVVGTVAGQGSKRHVGNGRMIEQSTRVAPWREAVTSAACDAIGEDRAFFPITAPVTVTVTFYFARPKGHYRSGRHAAELRPGAPCWQSNPPDADKCLRATLDALTLAGVWRDDAQVADVRARKKYADHRATGVPGATIRIEAL